VFGPGIEQERSVEIHWGPSWDRRSLRPKITAAACTEFKSPESGPIWHVARCNVFLDLSTSHKLKPAHRCRGQGSAAPAMSCARTDRLMPVTPWEFGS
jgi:hypothetical protein